MLDTRMAAYFKIEDLSMVVDGCYEGGQTSSAEGLALSHEKYPHRHPAEYFGYSFVPARGFRCPPVVVQSARTRVPAA